MKLESVSQFPNCDDGSYTVCTRSQAEWLLCMETILVDLIKMGMDDDAELDLKISVFGPQTTSVILGKFPSVLKHKLVTEAKAKPKAETLVTFLNQFMEWSKQALDLEKYEPEVRPPPKKEVILKQMFSTHQGPYQLVWYVWNFRRLRKSLPSSLICQPMLQDVLCSLR